MMHIFRILTLRLAIVIVTALGFITVLKDIHDYPQTRHAISNYEYGDGLLWVVMFYFVNEAGSGIKYALTGNERHFDHYPRMSIDTNTVTASREYEIALFESQRGDWREQVRLSHLLSLGWGIPQDIQTAVHWYRVSELTARNQDEHDQWLANNRRLIVKTLINPELAAEALQSNFIERWREDEKFKAQSQVISGQRS